MIKVDGFVCGYCKAQNKVKRVYANAGSCKRHEEVCYRNPAAKACATCEKWELVDFEYGDGLHAHVGRKCDEGHDCEDAGMCNGAILSPSPVRDCVFWIQKAA